MAELLQFEPILLEKFKEHMAWMNKNGGYLKHLQAIHSVGEGQPQEAASQNCNENKNRYINILPYDHSRVKLSPSNTVDGSDYVNATYMPGANSKHEYIASQGPLSHTAADFWQLVWEQDVHNIVMLTKCYEDSWEICYKYWPDKGKSETYRHLKVTAGSEESFSDWTVRNYTVTMNDSSRDVRHFHFKSWPDYGVPTREQTLVRFVRYVRSNLLPSEGPLVVHCSAGVGRTGTFLVVDRLLQQIKNSNSVSIYGTLEELRRERMWMVQTVAQYEYIHKCLLCVVEGKEDVDV